MLDSLLLLIDGKGLPVRGASLQIPWCTHWVDQQKDTGLVGILGLYRAENSFAQINKADHPGTPRAVGNTWCTQTHGEVETSGRQSALVSPPEYSTIHHYKVWLECGTWENNTDASRTTAFGREEVFINDSPVLLCDSEQPKSWASWQDVTTSHKLWPI